jgi:hypothetical protein
VAHAENLFRVFVSPTGGDEVALANGLANLREAFREANEAADATS